MASAQKHALLADAQDKNFEGFVLKTLRLGKRVMLWDHSSPAACLKLTLYSFGRDGDARLSCLFPEPGLVQQVIDAFSKTNDFVSSSVRVTLSPGNKYAIVSLRPGHLRAVGTPVVPSTIRRLDFVVSDNIGAIVSFLIQPYLKTGLDGFNAAFAEDWSLPVQCCYVGMAPPVALTVLQSICKNVVLPNIDEATFAMTNVFGLSTFMPGMLTFIDVFVLLRHLDSCRPPADMVRLAMSSADNATQDLFGRIEYFYSPRKDYFESLGKFGIQPRYSDNFRTCAFSSLENFKAALRNLERYLSSHASFQDEATAYTMHVLPPQFTLKTRAAGPLRDTETLVYENPSSPKQQISVVVKPGTEELVQRQVPFNVVATNLDDVNGLVVKYNAFGESLSRAVAASYRSDPRLYVDMNRGPKPNYMAVHPDGYSLEAWTTGPLQDLVAMKTVLKTTAQNRSRTFELSTYDKYELLDGMNAKPARITWVVKQNGEWMSSQLEYWRHGVRHRDGKPAVVKMDASGKKTLAEMWYNGRKIKLDSSALRAELLPVKGGMQFRIIQHGGTCWAGSVLTILLHSNTLSGLAIMKLNSLISTVPAYTSLLRGPLQLENLTTLILQLCYRALCTRFPPTVEELGAATTALESNMTKGVPGHSGAIAIADILETALDLKKSTDFEILRVNMQSLRKNLKQENKHRLDESIGLDVNVYETFHLEGAFVANVVVNHVIAAVNCENPDDNFVHDPNGFTYLTDWVNIDELERGAKRRFWKPYGIEYAPLRAQNITFVLTRKGLLDKSSGSRVCKSHYA